MVPQAWPRNVQNAQCRSEEQTRVEPSGWPHRPSQLTSGTNDSTCSTWIQHDTASKHHPNSIQTFQHIPTIPNMYAFFRIMARQGNNVSLEPAHHYNSPFEHHLLSHDLSHNITWSPLDTLCALANSSHLSRIPICHELWAELLILHLTAQRCSEHQKDQSRRPAATISLLWDGPDVSGPINCCTYQAVYQL
jgi:hypothetical protein